MRFVAYILLPLAFALVPACGQRALGAAEEPLAIIYGADEAFRPYEWFNDEGRLDGFQIELIREIGEVTGRRVAFVSGPWSTIRARFIEGSVDVVSMFDQPVRREYADFSNPHSVLASEIFIRVGSKPILSLEELNGKEVIQQAGALSTEQLQALGIRFTSIQVRDQFEAMRLLASGKHDCVVTTQVGGRYAIQKLQLQNITTSGKPILASNVAFAVKKGKTEILNLLNEGLSRLKANGSYEIIYQRWFGESNRIQLGEMRQMQRVLLFALAGLAFLIAAALLWVRLLRRAVKAKTFELQYLAEHDSLTGIYNRHYITTAIKDAIHDFHAHPTQRAFGILFIDLDRFKLVNDSLGHHVGDLVIKAVAFEILASVDNRCLVSRWGGDEFVVLVKSVPDNAALLKVAHKIADKLKTPYTFGGKDLYIGASVGAVMASLRYQSADQMLRDADNAMYRAKADKRTSVRVFEQQMHELAARNLRLSSDFQKAIGRGELINYYQPIYELKSGHLTGFEALVRWQHPELGLLAPGSFLPILEKTEAMRLLGETVMRTAVAVAKKWHETHSAEFYVSINVSDEQFAFGNLTEMLQALLEEYNLPPHCLRIEITETVLMADVFGGMSQLDELKRLGIRILIDDFGTGFSSLSHLATIPAETIKIDRSFVHGLTPNTKNFEIVRTILALSKNLHLGAVAEGIETAEERRLLTDLGCEFGQGYLFAAPMPPVDAEVLLSMQKA
jgi:diguanylate cyclase (GGDEF)-like protein